MPCEGTPALPPIEEGTGARGGGGPREDPLPDCLCPEHTCSVQLVWWELRYRSRNERVSKASISLWAHAENLWRTVKFGSNKLRGGGIEGCEG